MKQCPKPEELALFVGGDLDAIRNHVEECAECRELAQELRSDAAVLSKAVEVPQVSLDRLLVRVPQRIAARQRSKIWIAVASAAATLALAWAGSTLRAPVAEMPRQIVAIEAPPIATVTLIAATAVVRPVARKRRQPRAEERFRIIKTDATGEQLAVQVKSTDPNVVIILVGERGA